MSAPAETGRVGAQPSAPSLAMNAAGGAGRVRAQPGAPSLVARLSDDPAGIELVPPHWVPRRSAAEAESWFSALVPLRYDVAAIPALLPPGPVPEAMASGTGSPLRVAAVYREREGGRRYAYAIPGHTGPRLLGERDHRALGPRLLLQAIPRRFRSAFPAPAGHRFVIADLRHCFLVLLAAVAAEPALLDAAAGDLQKAAGDAVAPWLPAGVRRELGKRFNTAVVGLISAEGWHAELRRRGIAVRGAEAVRMHARWWDQFPAARRLRDRWVAVHQSAAARGATLFIRYPDGRRYTFDAATVRGTAPRPGWAHLTCPRARLAASIRTTFSAIWRGIEATILDEALHRVQTLRGTGVRLVLPTYDGLLLVAPTDSAIAAAGQVRGVLHDALAAVGVPGEAAVHVACTWGGAVHPATDGSPESLATSEAAPGWARTRPASSGPVRCVM